MSEQELAEKIMGFLSHSFRGAIYYNGEWLIGQDCYLEIPERRSIIKRILAFIQTEQVQSGLPASKLKEREKKDVSSI